MAIDPSLLPKIVVSNFCAKLSSPNRFLNHCTSRVASDKVTYLASMVDKAITDCFFGVSGDRTARHLEDIPSG